MQPEGPVEGVEAIAPVAQPCPTVDAEPAFLTSPSPPVAVPLSVANASEPPSIRETVASVSSPSSTGEPKSPLTSPQTVDADKPLADVPRTLAASPVTKALNGLADSRAEPDTAAHEPALLPTAARQPQASAFAYRETPCSETSHSDVRTDVPIAASLAPLTPVAVVPVTLNSSPAPTLPVMLPPGLPPLVQATTEADEIGKSLDTKDLVSSAGMEAHGGITDGNMDSQHAPTRKSPTTGTGGVVWSSNLKIRCHRCFNLSDTVTSLRLLITCQHTAK